MSGQNQKGGYFSEVKNFLIGGAAGMIATTAVLPVDYIKVHMQCMAEGAKGVKVSPLEFASSIYKEKGFRTFYSGLDSALLRQALYATTRLGLYRTLVEREKAATGQSAISFGKKFVYSSLAGGIGAVVGNPCDLALVRLQTDHSLPAEARRNYKSVVDALVRIPKEEGVLAYWRGCMPTVMRACAMNFGMLAPYDQCKEFMDRAFGVNAYNRFGSSIVAAVCACLVSLPFDNVKTKYQRMVKGPDGKYPYSGFADCFLTSIKREGVLGLYVGLPVFVLRVAPNVIITLLTIDLMHYLFSS